MTTPIQQTNRDLADGRRRFLEGLEQLRPRLHRYCTRLLSSPLDAEDVVQEALADAFFKGPILEPRDGLENWLFRVAHNRSMDVLRRRIVRSRPLATPPTTAQAGDPVAALQSAEAAFGRLVQHLPPRERTCLVCKDVLDYSLRETANFLGTSEGAVKAALHRARTKLRVLGDELPTTGPQMPAPDVDPEHSRLVSAYADRFNARDWDGLLSLLKADANLEVLEVFEGSGRGVFERHYFHNWSLMRVEWAARAVRVAGEPIMVIERLVDGEPRLYSAVRVGFQDDRISAVVDYLHVPWYLLEALAVQLDCGPPAGFEWSHFGGAD